MPRSRDANSPLRDIVNKSGLPFQIAVEHIVRQTQSEHGWMVISREFPSEHGFIDLLLKRKRAIAAFECKRVIDTKWIFLQPDQTSTTDTRCRLEWYNHQLHTNDISDSFVSHMCCSEFHMCEASPESDYCVIPKGSPAVTLEQICHGLLSACHKVLDEPGLNHVDAQVAIVPIIVTNAPLLTCTFRSTDVRLEDGTINEHNCDFKECDFIRFRKTFVTYGSDDESDEPLFLEDWSKDRERTVFVVQATKIVKFLYGFRSFWCQDGDKWPRIG